MCRSGAYIEFRPHAIVMGKAGVGVVLLRDWDRSDKDLRLDEMSQPTSAKVTYVECSTVDDFKVDEEAVRKNPAVADVTLAPLVTELMDLIDAKLLEPAWVRLEGDPDPDTGECMQMWFQASSHQLKKR